MECSCVSNYGKRVRALYIRAEKLGNTVGKPRKQVWRKIGLVCLPCKTVVITEPL